MRSCARALVRSCARPLAHGHVSLTAQARTACSGQHITMMPADAAVVSGALSLPIAATDGHAPMGSPVQYPSHEIEVVTKKLNNSTTMIIATMRMTRS